MTRTQSKRLLALAKQVVILRDGYRCLRCGKTLKGLNLSHLYPEGQYPRMKYNPDNLILLCFKCHLQWWHKNPIEAAEWYCNVLDAKRRARLKKLAKSKLDKPDYEVYLQLLQEHIIRYNEISSKIQKTDKNNKS